VWNKVSTPVVYVNASGIVPNLEEAKTVATKSLCQFCDQDHSSLECHLLCTAGCKHLHIASRCWVKCRLCNRNGHHSADCVKRCAANCKHVHTSTNCRVKCKLCGGKGHRESQCAFKYHR
jgi:hypothetical protein